GPQVITDPGAGFKVVTDHPRADGLGVALVGSSLAARGSGYVFVGRDREEVLEVIRKRDLLEDPLRVRVAALRKEIRADGLRGLDLRALAAELVLLRAEDAVELGHRRLDEVGMRYPRPVEAVVRFALLVVAHFRERGLGDGGITPVGDERRHAAEREGTTLVA